MQYHPKLKKAIQQIKKILDDNDIAGVVILHTPRFSEHLVKVNPSYSCARFEGDNLRIKAKAEDFKGGASERNKVIEDTSNMLRHLSECAGSLSISLIESSLALDKIVQATHFGRGGTSHTAQNN